MSVPIIGDPKCDNCGRSRAGVLTRVYLFGQYWHVCPSCSAALSALFSRDVAQLAGAKHVQIEALTELILTMEQTS